MWAYHCVQKPRKSKFMEQPLKNMRAWLYRCKQLMKLVITAIFNDLVHLEEVRGIILGP
jgi:hypothetical protein